MTLAGVFINGVAMILIAASTSLGEAGALAGIAAGALVCGHWLTSSADAACAAASKTSAHRPHRTQPLETLSWSGTILKTVSQAGQRVFRFIKRSKTHYSVAVINIQPSSVSETASLQYGA
jgi:hypothetical protein